MLLLPRIIERREHDAVIGRHRAHMAAAKDVMHRRPRKADRVAGCVVLYRRPEILTHPKARRHPRRRLLLSSTIFAG